MHVFTEKAKKIKRVNSVVTVWTFTEVNFILNFPRKEQKIELKLEYGAYAVI